MGAPTDHRLIAGLDRHFESVDLGPGGRVALVTARSTDKDAPDGEPNEDCAAVLRADGAVVLAVADGAGGHASGQVASRLAIEALAGAVAAVDDPDGLREAILSAFEAANRAVLDLGNGAATTLAVAEIRGGVVRTYHVGDSGVLIFGGRGRVRAQTIFHSPTGYAVEAGMLDADDALAHAERHLVSNVLGDPAMHVAMSAPVTLHALDTVLVASDGLFDNLYLDEIVECLRRGRLERAAAALEDRCARRMRGESPAEHPPKPDDLTLIAYRQAPLRRGARHAAGRRAPAQASAPGGSAAATENQ